MRAAIFIIAGLQIAALIFVGLTNASASEPAGNAMAQGFVTLAGIVMALFLVPALILAISRKAEKLALALAFLPLLARFLTFARA